MNRNIRRVLLATAIVIAANLVLWRVGVWESEALAGLMLGAIAYAAVRIWMIVAESREDKK